jgi:hypothetical protein
MNTTFIMNRWQQWLQSTLPQTHLYQIRNLARFSFAMACAQHCHLSRLVAHVPSRAKPPSTRRRLFRFLGNSRLDVKTICSEMAHWLLRWNHPQARLILLLDETPLQNDLRVLKISVAYRRRSLPLCWECEPLTPRSQIQSVHRLLEEAAAILQHYAPQAQVVLLCDRGLCWPQTLLWCQKRGFDFVMRAQRHMIIRRRDEQGQLVQQPLHDLTPQIGSYWCGAVTTFQKHHWLETNVVACWFAAAKEPWYLITSLKPTLHCCRWYLRRLWQEQSFRDEKSHGFNWQQSQVRNAERANRLLLIVALAQLWLTSLGTLALMPPWRTRLGLQTRSTRRMVSVMRHGWQLLLWSIHQNRKIKLNYGLCFTPT